MRFASRPVSWRGFPALRACCCAFVVLATILAACGNDDSESDGATATGTPIPEQTVPVRSPTELALPIRIAVTLPIFEEFARDAGLQNVEVISLIPPGADPHTYEFTAADTERMKGIDLFFVNGLGLDSRLQDVIEANRDEDAKVIPFAPNIRSPQGGETTAEEAGDNPHLWLDPRLAYVYAENVADQLTIYDGVHQGFYSDNFGASREKTLALQDQVQRLIDTIPPERRKLLTLHDSFVHFARRFGLTLSGFVADSPEGASQDEIDHAAQIAREQQLSAVFAEFGYDASPAQKVAAAAGIPVCTLYSDIIGGPVETYEDLMLANAQEIVRCLGNPSTANT